MILVPDWMVFLNQQVSESLEVCVYMTMLYKDAIRCPFITFAKSVRVLSTIYRQCCLSICYTETLVTYARSYPSII